MLRSHSLIHSDFDTAWYKRWAKALKQNKDNLDGHKLRANKFWQNAVMVQALQERGLLEPGKTGVGFGVGQERLPALFASLGVKVTATDQDYRTKSAKHWEKQELAFGLNSLNRLKICEPKKFEQNVSYQAVDMRKLPKNLVGSYDFVWSNCALGHLGSIEAGIQFILESAKCLRPGGTAVHTTEVNVINNIHTVTAGDTVIFRPRDIYQLSSRLLKAGFELSPLKLDFGNSPNDQEIDMWPQFGNDHSKLQVGGHLITQVVLIIKRPLKKTVGRNQVLAQQHRYAYLNNLLQQKAFASRHPFLRSIRAFERNTLRDGMIKPLQTGMNINLDSKPKYLYLSFTNQTRHPIFGMHERMHTTRPIALSTADPADRSSKFKADDWFNDSANRPSIFLCKKDKDGKWVKADYVRPGTTFAYRLKLDRAGVRKGRYTEKFMIVQEGVRHLPDTEVTVRVKVS